MALTDKPSSGLFRGPRAYEPRTPWPVARAVLASLLIVAVGILAAVLALGGVVPGKPAPVQLPQDTENLATLGIWQAATIILTIAASALFGGRIRDVLALRAPARGAAVYLEALLLMAALQMAVSAVQHTFFPQDMYADLRPFARLFGERWILALLVVGLGAPLSEELLFRGFLLSALAKSRIGFWGGAVITTGLWTALHAGYSTVGILEVALIGLFFSWLLWRTGSLWVAIVCHALYNSLIVIVLRHVPLPS
jgi:hypothetical protein